MGQPSPAAVTKYDIGDLVRSVASFVGTDNVTPAVPSQVVFYLRDPAGSVSSYVFGAAGASIVQVGSAAFEKLWTVSTSGTWAYRWVGTGLVQAADEWVALAAESFIL